MCNFTYVLLNNMLKNITWSEKFKILLKYHRNRCKIDTLTHMYINVHFPDMLQAMIWNVERLNQFYGP
jgi:hypothetical protein